MLFIKTSDLYIYGGNSSLRLFDALYLQSGTFGDTIVLVLGAKTMVPGHQSFGAPPISRSCSIPMFIYTKLPIIHKIPLIEKFSGRLSSFDLIIYLEKANNFACSKMPLCWAFIDELDTLHLAVQGKIESQETV